MEMSCRGGSRVEIKGEYQKVKRAQLLDERAGNEASQALLLAGDGICIDRQAGELGRE